MDEFIHKLEWQPIRRIFRRQSAVILYYLSERLDSSSRRSSPDKRGRSSRNQGLAEVPPPARLFESISVSIEHLFSVDLDNLL
ncbi:unnamed protein product [Euphydryas editha]|uniref:Maturase K n=1 Tax=Euphydryas editha TaxID=104508 RepID=A0AAU9TU22_EUPED|nr:unnamed protein product [Euphydryas editha]